MENKELDWLKRRRGYISASELNNMFSASGKMTDTNVAYIRHKRFERKHGFTIPVSARAMDIGKEQERYAYEWICANFPELDLIHAASLDEIPFWKAAGLHFGASPDTFTADRKIIVEIKTVVGVSETEYWDDETISYEAKADRILADHGAQLAGQLLTSPETEEIWLCKYIYQNDEIDEDTDSPLAPWRGHIFKFKRDMFDLDGLAKQIEMYDRWIDGGCNVDVIQAEFNASLKASKKDK